MRDTSGLKPFHSLPPEKAKEIRQKGGKAKAEVIHKRKLIADALREVLDEPVKPGDDMTRLDAISVKAVKKLFDDPNIKDVKTLAEVLGEIKTNLQVEGSAPIQVVVNSEEEKEKLDKLMNGEL